MTAPSVDHVFVQRAVFIAPPLTVGTLRALLDDLPADGGVEILDGELIAVRWERHEPLMDAPMPAVEETPAGERSAAAEAASADRVEPPAGAATEATP